MTLVDTSVWMSHLSRNEPGLKRLLADTAVLTHPFVIGELACSRLHQRHEILQYLAALPQCVLATHEETLRMLEDHAAYGRGIGWVDAHLLASTLLTGCCLWTADRRLRELASRLRVAYH